MVATGECINVFGLSGSHRVGKSTLAKLISEKQKLPFAQLNEATRIFKEMGLVQGADYPVSVVLEVQNRILEAADVFFQEFINRNGTTFISDRTPVDMAAYMMALVGRSNVTTEEQNLIATYLKDCRTVCSSYFSMIMLVQPGIPYVAEEGKPPPNLMYQEHIAALIYGLPEFFKQGANAPHFYRMDRSILRLEDRVFIAHECYTDQMQHVMAERKQAVLH